MDNGTLKCWGRNTYGELGLGDTANRGDDPNEMGDSLPVVVLAGSGVWGTVTETGSGSPVAGAWVAFLRTSDFTIAGGAVADATGNYDAPVAPGAYYLYVIDPTGRHTEGFFGPPTTVTVAADAHADADPVMAPTRGSITGTITDQGTGTPISGAWALSLSAATGVPQTAVVANGSGQFTLAGVAAASHLMIYVDPAGGHVTRFFGGSTDANGSTRVAVTAGNATTASQALPTQAWTPPIMTGFLYGQVTEAGTANPLAGVFVMALRAADYRFVTATVTNFAGNYNLDTPGGAYKLVFFDSTGLHNLEWHNNQPYYNLANAASVTAPAETNAALDRNTGSMAGTITDDPAGTPVPGAWVIALGPSGIAGGATTAANGTYTITGLPPGTYRATFVDPNGGRTQEYFNNSPTYNGATTFNITAANTTTIYANLHHP